MPKPEFRNSEEVIEEMIRVNHAGEYGAVKIYEGQMSHANNAHQKTLVYQMLTQEKEHLKFFHNKIATQSMRPSLMLPIWNVLGSLAGKLSSFCGNKSAMMLTESIENVISEHYLEQIKYLSITDQDRALLEKIEKFREEELEHHDVAIDNDSQHTKGYLLWNKIIQFSCRFAIKISKKI